jgi:hypothetical protein
MTTRPVRVLVTACRRIEQKGLYSLDQTILLPATARQDERRLKGSTQPWIEKTPQGRDTTEPRRVCVSSRSRDEPD